MPALVRQAVWAEPGSHPSKRIRGKGGLARASAASVPCSGALGCGDSPGDGPTAAEPEGAGARFPRYRLAEIVLERRI